MATGMESWSTTASANAGADSNVNWAEGMTPGAVNNSARAEMASAAMWRNDNRGTITTGGTSTAFTATSSQTLSLSDGVTITVQLHTTSGSSPTLNVDSTGAKAIQKLSGTAVPPGALKQGGIYTFTYRSSADAWIGRGNPGERDFNAGDGLIAYGDAAPTGWSILTTNTDDRALRIVSGSGAGGGTGGTLAGTTAFTDVLKARTIAANQLPNVTITITDPGHLHSGVVGNATFGLAGGANATAIVTPVAVGSNTTGITAAIDNTARGGVSQQTIDFAVKYANCIIIVKD